MKETTGAGSIMDALSQLMGAVQTEGKTLTRLIAIYRKGGQHWADIKERIDEIYASLEPEEKESGPSGDMDDRDEKRRHGDA